MRKQRFHKMLLLSHLFEYDRLLESSVNGHFEISYGDMQVMVEEIEELDFFEGWKTVILIYDESYKGLKSDNA